LEKGKGKLFTRRRAPPRCGRTCSFEGVSEASTEGIKRTRDIHINWLGPVNGLKVSVCTVPRRGYTSRNEGNPPLLVHTWFHIGYLVSIGQLTSYEATFKDSCFNIKKVTDLRNFCTNSCGWVSFTFPRLNEGSLPHIKTRQVWCSHSGAEKPANRRRTFGI